jgi:hypothetical protein
MNESEYQEIIVESFKPADTSGRHGPIHIRPIPGQNPFLETLSVSCSKELSYSYPVGTKFRIKAKLSKRGDTPYIYSSPTLSEFMMMANRSLEYESSIFTREVRDDNFVE